MNLPADHNDFESSLRGALGGRRRLTFDDWRAQHGDALNEMGRRLPSLFFGRRTQIMKWSAAILTTAAVTAVVWISSQGMSAEQAFAQAIDHAAKAKTFSADEVMTYTTKDGQQRRVEQRIMFKQPHLERQDDMKDGRAWNADITDYGNRRHLHLNFEEKAAWPRDLSNSFEVDPESGNVRLTKLNTSARDHLLSLQSRAVDDLGQVELNGRTVRLTQSANEQRVVKVWSDPQTGHPVQISIERPNQKDIISNIRIDEELSDEVFSLMPPADYEVKPDRKTTRRYGEAIAKAMYLALQCLDYEAKHPKTFPAQLSDLDLKPEVLQNLLTLPDGGRLVYVPLQKSDDLGKRIMIHEAFDTWPEQGIVTAFDDGHGEHIAKEEIFKQLLQGRTQ
jgi:outer membrane lipoprotein-sorting protein